MSKREKIIQTITITYEPRREDYGIYDIAPDSTYEMAAYMLNGNRKEKNP